MIYENLLNFVRRKFFYLDSIFLLSEDIVQEAYVSLLSSPGYEPEKENFGYLSVICSRIAYRYYELQKKHQFESEEELIDIPSVLEADSPVLAADERRAVMKSLQALAELERVIISQRYYGGFTFAQIAEQTGINLNTVLTRHRRALLKLRPMLSEYHGEPVNPTRKTKKERIAMKKNSSINTYAERLKTLSVLVACQCASSPVLHGFMIIADEMRHISNAILNLQTDADAARLSTQLETLCVNTAITANNAGYHGKEMAVLAEEIRECVFDITAILSSGKKREDGVFSPPLTKSTVLTQKIGLLCTTAGGRRIAENLSFIQEVLSLVDLKENINDGKLYLRGEYYPVVRLSASGECAVMVKSSEDGRRYCLIVDRCGAEAIVNSPIAQSAAPSAPTDCREVWLADDGGTLEFLSYPKFA